MASLTRCLREAPKPPIHKLKERDSNTPSPFLCQCVRDDLAENSLMFSANGGVERDIDDDPESGLFV